MEEIKANPSNNRTQGVIKNVVLMIEGIDKEIAAITERVDRTLKPVPSFLSYFTNEQLLITGAAFDFKLADLQDHFEKERRLQLIKVNCLFRKKVDILRILGIKKPTLKDYIDKGFVIEHAFQGWETSDDRRRKVYYDILEIKEALICYLEQARKPKRL